MPAQVPKTQELGSFAASFRRLRSEKSSASGGLRPLPLDPATPLGALPPDLRYRLALRARHGLAPSNENFCLRPWIRQRYTDYSSCTAQTLQPVSDNIMIHMRLTSMHCLLNDPASCVTVNDSANRHVFLPTNTKSVRNHCHTQRSCD